MAGSVAIPIERVAQACGVASVRRVPLPHVRDALGELLAGGDGVRLLIIDLPCN